MNDGNVEIKNGIFWVGSVDWNLRDFHGYTTPKGTTYNAFLIGGDEPALLDTVKGDFAPELLGKIRKIVDPASIRHFIVNHIEPDHSGSFPEVLKALPGARVYATEIARDGLARYYGDFGREITIVRSGEEIRAGGRLLRFVETPMAHWPDSMITYMPEEKVLFSSDIFGQHIATSERFDYEIDPPYYDAAVYYANIVLPYSHLVLKIPAALEKYGVAPEIVLPDHGIFWKDHIGDIIEHYISWASGSCARGVVILYDTMWGSTEILANRIYEEIVARGVHVKKLHVRKNPLSLMVTEIMFARAILIGSPTINNTIFPSVGQLLAYVKGLNPRGRLWSAFGSYGWGGGAVEYIRKWLAGNHFELATEPLAVEFRPAKDELDRCAGFAEEVARRLSESGKSS